MNSDKGAKKLSLGVLVSGRGSNLQVILDRCQEGSIPAQVNVVISDRPGAFALERASEKGVPTYTVRPKSFGKWPECKPDYEAKLVEILKSHGVELVVLAGYNRLAGSTLLDAFKMKVINVHPAILPSFPGLEAQKQALEYGVKIAGASVFFVDLSVDGGPLIVQGSCNVLEGDSVDALSNRILEIEHRILPEAIKLIALGKVKIDGRRVLISG